MATESLPHDDGAEKPSITPLSFFFPEVTEEEAKTLDGETFRIMERRTRIMEMYRRGLSMQVIATELKCSAGTVHHDIHCVLDGYRRIAARSAEEHVAEALQMLASREADVQREWDRSKGDFRERSTANKSGVVTEQTKKVVNRQRYGDPRLFAQLMGIWDRRCKLVGILNDAPKTPDAREAVAAARQLVVVRGPREVPPPIDETEEMPA